MVEIVGVGFMKSGKTYYFNPREVKYELGDMVIVETARGMELGHILIENKMIDEKDLLAELKPIERKATEQDLDRYHKNVEKREDAMKVCAEKIEKHGLDMKLVDAEFMIDGVNGFLADQQFESTADCVIKYSTMPTKEKESVKNHALDTVLDFSPKHVVSSFSDILKI